MKSFLTVGKMREDEMGIGEMGVGETGVGEMGTSRNNEPQIRQNFGATIKHSSLNSLQNVFDWI